MTTLIGSFAAVLTTVCWLPQVIKTTRTRQATDFHWLWLTMLGVGVAAWLIYGILQQDPPIYLANGVTLCFLTVIAAVKTRAPVRPSSSDAANTLISLTADEAETRHSTSVGQR